jgi:G3E family GTPase
LTILTGFLGAGKTTLLNRWLRDPLLAGTVVIVNELGDIALDHPRVETLSGNTLMLTGGCICCSLRGDLAATLETLLRGVDNHRLEPFRRVIMETTGLAEPAPILQTVPAHPYLGKRFFLDAVITVVDSLHAAGTITEFSEAAQQIAVADILVAAKTDVVFPDRLDALRLTLDCLAPGVPLLEGTPDAPSVADMQAHGLLTANPRRMSTGRSLLAEAANPHTTGIDVFHLTSSEPVSTGTLTMFFELLQATFGSNILRIKGLVATRDHPEKPVALQGVRHTLDIGPVLDAWPDDDHRTRLLFITRDLQRARVEALWNAFRGSG